MAPRNNDPSTSCKRSYPAVDQDMQTLLPCLLHKKHKVVKLVKNQMRKGRKEGIIDVSPESQPDSSEEEIQPSKSYEEPADRRAVTRPEHFERRSDTVLTTTRERRRSFWWYLLLLLLQFLFLVFLMAYISAGPLSNSSARTPISPGSFVRLERPCHLEKKYLLRWSRPELTE